MIDVYSHDAHKFADNGLQLRLPVDSIPANQYSRLSNCVADIEGQLETRAGMISLASISGEGLTLPVHTIFRLNQNSMATASNRLIGAGHAIFVQQLPSGTPNVAPNIVYYDGTPIEIIDFRFDNDPSSWAIIANRAGNAKQRLPNLFQLLGQTPPTVKATGAAGGAGLLNNGSGPGYDWRYTYVNSIVNTQSNPSPVNMPTGTQRPTLNLNPDTTVTPPVGVIQTGCTNPTNAYDNNPATYAAFAATANPTSQQSCVFYAWVTIGAVPSVNINVTSAVTVTGDTGYVVASIYWSKDLGVTWNTLMSTNVSRSQVTDTVNIPLAVDLANIRVRGLIYGSLTIPGGGGGEGGGGCPISGTPVKLYGDPAWWTMEVKPCENFIEIVTVKGRKGLFHPDSKHFCNHGLIPIRQWEAGFYALVDDSTEGLEMVESVRNVHIEGATIDSYHATQGNVYSANGFVCHNNKVIPPAV